MEKEKGTGIGFKFLKAIEILFLCNHIGKIMRTNS